MQPVGGVAVAVLLHAEPPAVAKKCGYACQLEAGGARCPSIPTKLECRVSSACVSFAMLMGPLVRAHRWYLGAPRLLCRLHA